jgi:hypothetical protein
MSKETLTLVLNSVTIVAMSGTIVMLCGTVYYLIKADRIRRGLDE